MTEWEPNPLISATCKRKQIHIDECEDDHLNINARSYQCGTIAAAAWD